LRSRVTVKLVITRHSVDFPVMDVTMQCLRDDLEVNCLKVSS